MPVKHLPTVKQLRYFVALQQFTHFGKAAEACFVSQSAFSSAIKELEALLGTRLVDRTNKRVTITGAGQEIAIQARLVLRDLEDLVDLAAGQGAPLCGRLRLGVIPTIAPFLLPRVIRSLQTDYPELQLYLTEDLTERLHVRLMSGELDLILIALPYPLRGVSFEVLFRDRFHLAYREDTRRIDPEHFRINRLNSESILLLEDGHCLRGHALDLCRVKNLDTVSRFSASSLFSLVQMINEDLGVSFLPEMALESPLLAETRIRTRPLAEESAREIALGWRLGSGRIDEFQRLGALIREHAPHESL